MRPLETSPRQATQSCATDLLPPKGFRQLMVRLNSTSGLSSTMRPVLPEADVARIRELCEARVPPETREHVRVELEQERQAVNIVERRPPWRED
jgi:hypothetical protein